MDDQISIINPDSSAPIYANGNGIHKKPVKPEASIEDIDNSSFATAVIPSLLFEFYSTGGFRIEDSPGNAAHWIDVIPYVDFASLALSYQRTLDLGDGKNRDREMQRNLLRDYRASVESVIRGVDFPKDIGIIDRNVEEAVYMFYVYSTLLELEGVDYDSLPAFLLKLQGFSEEAIELLVDKVNLDLIPDEVSFDAERFQEFICMLKFLQKIDGPEGATTEFMHFWHPAYDSNLALMRCIYLQTCKLTRKPFLLSK